MQENRAQACVVCAWYDVLSIYSNPSSAPMRCKFHILDSNVNQEFNRPTVVLHNVLGPNGCYLVLLHSTTKATPTDIKPCAPLVPRSGMNDKSVLEASRTTGTVSFLVLYVVRVLRNLVQ